MVLLPLPLSPASATICRSPSEMLTSSTACSVRRDSALPILKCRVSPSVRSSSVTGFSRLPAGSLVQEAADLGAVDLVQVGRRGLAPGHDLRAARREPAALRRPGQVGRAARDTG